MKGICRVCELLDNDTKEKNIIWCNFCQAAMCKQCEANWYRRGLAAIKEKTDKLLNND